MCQDTPCRWLCLAGPCQSRIQQCTVLYWMFALCLSMLSTAVMVQAAPTQNKDATSTGDDRFTALAASSTAIAAENSLASDEVKEIFLPQSTVAAIIFLVDGLVWGFFGTHDSDGPSELNGSSDSNGSDSSWKFRPKEFMTSFTAGVIEGYMFFIAIVPFDGGEADSVKKIACIVVSCGVGLLAGILSARYRRIDIIVIASIVGGFYGIFMILDLKPDTFITNTAGLIAFRVFLFVTLAACVAFLAHLCEKSAVLVKAFSSSFFIVLGIDFFLETKFTTRIVDFLDFNSDAVHSFDTGAYVMWGILFVLTVVFTTVQRHRDHKTDNSSSESARKASKKAKLIIYIFFLIYIIIYFAIKFTIKP